MDKPVRESESTKLTPKAIAGRFKIVRELGRGGAGIVYEGVQLSVDRRVAIKVLLADHQAKDDHVERFEREAKAIARLSHTNCITLFDFGYSDEFRANYMVMEYIEGEELFAITRDRKLPLEIALRIAIQLAEAIAHAHKHGILHRDLKPENVLVTTDWEVKVLDFGLARLLDLFAADSGGRRLTAEGAIFGTPAYMSPEQCSGDLDVTVRSDIYSLGIVLYELFEGQLPFQGKEVVKILVQHAKDPPPPMQGDIPQDVKALVMQMLAKDPHSRPRTGTQVADRLRAALIHLANESPELSADVSQEIQRSLLRGIDRTNQTGEIIRITEDGLETGTEPMDDELDLVEPGIRVPTMELGGRKLQDYALGALIAEGPNCSVFRGTSPTAGDVAIRVYNDEIPPAVRGSNEFAQRLAALQRLRGPTVAAVLDSGHDPQADRFYTVGEFVNGDDLRAICAAGRAPIELAVLIARDVAMALNVAHTNGIVHRGLTPSNVMLSPGAEGRPRAKVLDFGVAAIAEVRPPTYEGAAPESLHYTAPEQLRGDETTTASDLYAFGVILYQLLSGHTPFEAKGHTELATQILTSTSPPLAEYVREVPEPLSELVAQMMNKNPAKRPPTAQEVLTRLNAIQANAQVREVRVDHQGKSTDVVGAWRLRRSVQAPAPGGQTVRQRSTSQEHAIPDDDEFVAPSRAGAIVLAMAVAAALVVLAYVLLDLS